MRSLSFDSMAELYDGTRVFDKDCFEGALDFLVERFPPKVFNNLFEAGIGTGRIAVPLAGRGYRVFGADVSRGMLALLEKRLAESRGSLRLELQEADATTLPYPDGIFDIAVAVHLFYFIDEWKKAANELLRVVRADGPVVLMHTGMGTEIPYLNERYRELCAEQGFPVNEVGVRSTREVVDYFGSLGCRVEWILDRWTWTSRIRLDEALDYVRSRAYSFTSAAPDEVHSMAVERLRSEAQRRFGDLSSQVEVPNQIYLVVILRSGA
jgi:ubiquinone/menaquinone biosynthesis C-methylase UbiE